jgi:hypothetical protein
MSKTENQSAIEFYALTYDKPVSDRPGKPQFYKKLAAELYQMGENLLYTDAGKRCVMMPPAR